MAGECLPELEAEIIQDCARMPMQMMNAKYGKALITIKEWRIGLHNEPDEREVYVSMNKAHWFTWSAVAQLWRRIEQLEGQLAGV